jgi:methyl-accepting chemotaxis protein
MIFLFLIILVLSVFSGYYLNKLSNKTGAILKENYLSFVYAREISSGLLGINNLFMSSYLSEKIIDTSIVRKNLRMVAKSIDAAQKNITEPGEDELVARIVTDFEEYRDSAILFMNLPTTAGNLLHLQSKATGLYKDVEQLSELNGTAMETKTDDAKVSSKTAFTRMSVLVTICFLIGLSFTYSFALHFNERFLQLYNGINDIASGDYSQKIYMEGNDEFYKISMAFNAMTDKITRNKQKMSVTLPEDLEKGLSSENISDLKKDLYEIKRLEEHALETIARLEKK